MKNQQNNPFFQTHYLYT